MGNSLKNRSGRTPWAVLLFLFGFVALLVIVSRFYLLPAMEAAKAASPSEKQGLVAYSRLLLVIVLVILFAGLIITFRIGRFFLPRHAPPAGPTRYSDAWAESGKRLKMRPQDNAGDADEPDEPAQ